MSSEPKVSRADRMILAVETLAEDAVTKAQAARASRDYKGCEYYEARASAMHAALSAMRGVK